MAKGRTIVGLDIGRAVVTAAWVESGGGAARVTRVEQVKLPPGAVDPRGVLLPWLIKHRVAQQGCVIGIPGYQAMFQPFMLPPGDPRALDVAAAMETVKFNEMANETMSYGYTPIALNEGEKRLLLTMARPSVLATYLTLAKDAGLDILDMVPTPVALYAALRRTAGATDGVCLYVGMGHSATDIAIASDKAGLLFARAFASGGQLFSDRLAREQRINAAQAESIKTRIGSLLPDTEHATVLKQAADQWLTEVESCLSVYRNLFRGRNTEIVRVVLAGGASVLPGLSEYTGAKLNLPVESAATLAGQYGMEDPVTCAVATGLGLCGHGAAGAHISLLPTRMREELTFRRQKVYWIAAAVLAALILGVSLVGGLRDARRQSAKLRQDRASLRRRQDLVSDIEQIHARSEHIRRLAEPVRRMAHSAPALRRLIDLVGQKKSPRDEITLICDADSYFFDDEPAPERERAMGMRERKRREQLEGRRMAGAGITNAVIRGFTRRVSLETVKQLIDDLRGSGFVASADLLSDDKLVGGQAVDTNALRRGRSFVIEVRLSQP